MGQDNWKSFFGKNYIKFSEEILSPERTKWEVQQLLLLLNLKPGAKVLDLGCGQGRISIPLAEQGYEVTGIDISEDLLNEASRRARDSNQRIEFIHGDMRNLSYQEEYDAIINLGTAFGYVRDNNDNLNIYKGIYTALKYNGIFIQETENRDFKIRNYNYRVWQNMNDKIVWSERNFNTKDSKWTEEISWFEEEEIKNSILTLRLYTPSELIDMQETSGLNVLNLYGGYDLSNHHIDSPRTLIISKKEKGDSN